MQKIFKSAKFFSLIFYLLEQKHKRNFNIIIFFCFYKSTKTGIIEDF